MLKNEIRSHPHLRRERIPGASRLSGTVIARSRDVVTKGVADQFGPVLQLQQALRSAVRPVVDVTDARARIASRRPGFDPVKILSRARTVVTAFDRCVDALEVAGLASSTTVTALRNENYDARSLAIAWAAGETTPNVSSQRLGHNARQRWWPEPFCSRMPRVVTHNFFIGELAASRLPVVRRRAGSRLRRGSEARARLLALRHQLAGEDARLHRLRRDERADHRPRSFAVPRLRSRDLPRLRPISEGTSRQGDASAARRARVDGRDGRGGGPARFADLTQSSP